MSDSLPSSLDDSNDSSADSSEHWHALTVDESEDQERLDSFLVRHFSNFSRVKLQRAISSGDVTLDGKKAKSSTRVKADQRVRFKQPEPQPEGSLPEDIPLDILYEDDWLVAINKPPAMVVHPAKGHWSGTLTAGLAFHFKSLSSVGGPTRPGIVHRLDRDTSGVIIVAKTDNAHHHLSSQFQNRTVKKEYLAIVSPAPDRDSDFINKPIGAHPYQREKKAIRENHATSREAQSVFEVQERFQGFALILVKPRTGRTHQIRVHMAHAGCAVLCDRLYSGRATLRLKDLTRRDDDDTMVLDRQALHAHRIEFEHPETGDRMAIEAPLAKDIEQTLEMLKSHRPLG